MTVECDGQGNAAELQAWLDSNGGASASDDCSAISWSNDYSALSDGCGATGSVTVTFTVTDGCSNSNSTSATFTIADTTDPVFDQSLPEDTTEECSNVSDAAVLTASDGCGSANVVLNEEMIPGDCPGEYTITRTWTAMDELSLIHI